MTDPLGDLLRRRTALVVAAGVVTSFVLAWAVWPLPDVAIVTSPDFNHQTMEPKRASELDFAAFDADLWPVPPKPVQSTEAAAAPPPPPPPPRIALLGLIQSDGEFVAAIQDVKRDRVLHARVGDTIDGYEVTAIDAKGITLSGPSAVHHLKLQETP